MSLCPRCRHENPGDAKFCLECGGRLALACGACGTELPAGAKFCKECGQAVGAVTPLAAPRTERPPESYTPRHLAAGDNEAWSLYFLAAIGAGEEPALVEVSEQHRSEALALAEPRGMRPLVSHCYLGLGKLYQRMGKREEAQEHLATATTMYHEMGMTYWLEKAAGEMERTG